MKPLMKKPRGTSNGFMPVQGSSKKQGRVVRLPKQPTQPKDDLKIPE